MNKLHTFLTVKHKTLAVEASIIRKEENKLRGMTEWAKNKSDTLSAEEFRDIRMNLQHHRKSVVGLEARATHIALAYLKGKPYVYVESQIDPTKYYVSKRGNEQKVIPYHYYDQQTWKRVIDIVAKYESERAYNWRTARREIPEVQAEVYAWRNQHPQFFGEKTEKWVEMTKHVPRVKKPYVKEQNPDAR